MSRYLLAWLPMVAIAWLGLTLAFEVAVGRLVSGLSWGEILAEYDVSAGRLWVLVPLWVALGPYVLKKASAVRPHAR